MGKSLWVSGSSACLAMLVLVACGGGSTSNTPPPPPTFAIGGTVSGLQGSAVLQDNAGDDLTISANGNFTFATTLLGGAAYQVTVKTQPTVPSQTCTVTNGSGAVAAAAVTTVTVQCVTNTFTVGGTVGGLAGTGLVLQDNGGDDLAVAAGASSFTFATSVASGAPYLVSVKTQPTGPAQTCTVAGSAGGTVGGAAVASVVVTCTTNSVACGSENGTVVTHASDIAASETWAGDGTVHLVPNQIAIAAPAVVTVQKCAIVKLGTGAGIDVRGAATGTATASLISAGTDFSTGFVLFQNVAGNTTSSWGRLRGINGNSLIELDNTKLSGGGNVGGSQLNAVISMNASGVLPVPTLKVVNVSISAPAGAGIYFSNAAFTSDSNALIVIDQTDSMLAMPAMALGSIPPGVFSGTANPALAEVKVVENANIFDNLTISTNLPIHFKTNGVHVGGLAPSFVPNVTLTLEHGVTLKFEGLTGPPLVTFGDQGQPTDKNAALVVHGTAGSPVTFTSGAATPTPGDWAGLWLVTSNGSQIDNAIIEYAGGDAAVGPASCGPFDPSIAQRARHTAALLVGDGTDQQYVPPAGLITNSIFRNNTGNFAIDSVWEASAFGPALNATNSFGGGAKFCTQSKNLKIGGCFVAGVDQSGCLVP